MVYTVSIGNICCIARIVYIQIVHMVYTVYDVLVVYSLYIVHHVHMVYNVWTVNLAHIEDKVYIEYLAWTTPEQSSRNGSETGQLQIALRDFPVLLRSWESTSNHINTYIYLQICSTPMQRKCTSGMNLVSSEIWSMAARPSK